MGDLELLKLWLEVQIKEREQTIQKRSLFRRQKMRWMMAEVCGMDKVLARINLMIKAKESANGCRCNKGQKCIDSVQADD